MFKRRYIIVSLLFILLAVQAIMAPQSIVAATSFDDGEHPLPFEVLKDTSDDISATSEYMVSPAKLSIENGEMHVIVTLNNSSWWQSFEVKTPSGTYEAVTILSENLDNNTRVVSFPIDDLTKLLLAKIHIIVTGIPGFDYDNTYDIRFKFDYSHLPQELEPEDAEVDAEENGAGIDDAIGDAENLVEEDDIITGDESELEVTDGEPAQHLDTTTDQYEQQTQGQSEDQIEDQIEEQSQEQSEDANASDDDTNVPEINPADSQDEISSNIFLFIIVALILIIFITVIFFMRKRN